MYVLKKIKNEISADYSEYRNNKGGKTHPEKLINSHYALCLNIRFDTHFLLLYHQRYFHRPFPEIIHHSWILWIFLSEHNAVYWLILSLIITGFYPALPEKFCITSLSVETIDKSWNHYQFLAIRFGRMAKELMVQLAINFIILQ